MFLILCTIQQFHSQEDGGIVALALPVRKTLKFNRYAVNPTFSFVREQHKYLSFTNKKQWAQFNDAPNTYLFSYAGRFSENTGAGISLFQQDFGVLTTFGGMLNFAYNASLSRESNLTFGLNVGAYQSGLNQGKIIVNTPDPSLQNTPSTFLITVNPGINYGTGFLDFGVAIQNLVSYNITESQIIEDNPEQGLQAHFMYTGYVETRGFFDDSKFSTLIRSEFKQDQTIISGLAMLSVPKGIWAQAGYNTLYGASAGIGVNITSTIAFEYNYEQSFSNFSEFGSSHEVTIAYRFKNKYRYNYGDEDEEQSVFNTNKRRAKPNNLTDADRERIAERRAVLAAERKAKAEVEKAKVEITDANAQNTIAQNKTDATLELEEELKLKKVQEQQLKAENERKRIEEEARLGQVATQKKIEAEKAKAEAEAQQKRNADIKAEEARKIAETKTKAETEKVKQLALEAQQREKEVREKAAADKRRVEEENRLKLLEEAQNRKVQQEAKAEQLRLEAEAEAIAKAQEEKRLQLVAAQEKIETEAKLKAEALARAEREAVLKAKAEKEKAQAKIKAKVEEARLKENEIAKSNAETITITEDVSVENQPEANDDAAIALKDVLKASNEATKTQSELIKRLTSKIVGKQNDLNDLKEENDLSEKGIYLAPKPFKSLSAENAEIESLKDEIAKIEEAQNIKMVELEALIIKRKRKFRKDIEGINQFYFDALAQIKTEQLNIKSTKERLVSNLVQIKEKTDFERKRRIRRAAYDSQQDRFNKDKAALERIKKFTETGKEALKEEDFDFGEAQTKNIQIIKNVLNEASGYYIVLAVHNSVKKRDEFLTKVVASGEQNVNFFFDVSTNKYFIYYEKYDTISQAKNALDKKGNKPYNSKMSLVKIDN